MSSELGFRDYEGRLTCSNVVLRFVRPLHGGTNFTARRVSLFEVSAAQRLAVRGIKRNKSCSARIVICVHIYAIIQYCWHEAGCVHGTTSPAPHWRGYTVDTFKKALGLIACLPIRHFRFLSEPGGGLREQPNRGELSCLRYSFVIGCWTIALYAPVFPC